MRQRQTTAAYQTALRKRQGWVAPLVGEAKDWHPLRQFRRRGLATVNRYGLRVAAGQNRKRYVAAIRRGHRPAEAQCAVAVLPACYLIYRALSGLQLPVFQHAAAFAGIPL